MKNPFSVSLATRRRQAAGRYAASCKSDPFAYSRALAHIKNGIVGHHIVTENGRPKEVNALYDADTFPCQREVDPRWEGLQEWQRQHKLQVTEKVPGTHYKNVCRV